MDASVTTVRTANRWRSRFVGWRGLGFLLAAGLVLLLVAQRPRLLMDHASVVTLYQAPPGDIISDHRWMPNGHLRVLILPHAQWAKVVDVDTRSGTVRSTRDFRMATNASYLSPDGSWLLSLSGLSKRRLNRTAYSVDGGRQITAAKSATPTGIMDWKWERGSRAWIEVDVSGGTRIVEYAITGRSPTVYRLPAPKPTVPLWIDSNNRLVTRRFKMPAGQPDGFDEIRLDRNPTVRHLSFAVPPDVQVAAAVLSPDERYVAWHLVSENSSAKWWQRIASFVLRRPAAKGPISVESLWISDRNGANMRELGRLDQSVIWRRIGDLQWTRDGSRLTFTYLNRLYAVDVDR